MPRQIVPRRRVARLLGLLTTLAYRASGRITLSPGLLGNGRLQIRGPGRVVLEADVNAWSHAEVNRLITTRSHAVIHIGKNVRLNGCTLVAAERIEVGEDCVLGSCEIRDQEPIALTPGLRPAPGEARPVIVEANAWIGGQVFIAPGVHIGRNAVVGLHAAVFDDVPPDVIVAGNPARVVRHLEPGSDRNSANWG